MLFVCYPACGTCKKAEKHLKEMNVEYTVRNIREEKPTKEELKEWIAKSDREIRKWFNTSGQAYRNGNVKEKLAVMNEEEILNLLASDGMLVKRPVLIDGTKVLVGYKKEEYDLVKK
ncbi:MAG: arsenate reductase family protein [Erysipelotrichaceae bacterium]|nr:arsenate reductase family protein [Erysipelotrichaceae bacterium]